MTRSTVLATRGAATTASAVVRGLAAALAGFLLTAGLAMVLWALSPADGAPPAVAVRSGAVAFAAAHFLPVTISGAALTLRPLLLTAVIVAVIGTAAGRARPVVGRGLEAMHAAVFVAVYAVSVDLVVRLVAPGGAATAGILAPLIVAAVGASLSLARRDTAWRVWLVAALPPWIRAAFRSAAATLMALVALAAAVLAAALAVSFPDALGITEITVHSLGDAVGVTLLCLAFVPNAVIAAIGYASGAGVSLGGASYSPLAVHTADLPAIPLLSALPSGPGGLIAWSTLAVPVVAALVGALTLRGAGRTRWQRLAAVAVMTVAVAGAMAAMTAAGRGGVAGGAWQTMGSAPLLAAALVGGVTLLVAVAVVVPGRRRDSVRLGECDVIPAATQAISADEAAALFPEVTVPADPESTEDIVISGGDDGVATPPEAPDLAQAG